LQNAEARQQIVPEFVASLLKGHNGQGYSSSGNFDLRRRLVLIGAGSDRMNSHPRGLAATAIVPLWLVMMPCTTESPRPVPEPTLCRKEWLENAESSVARSMPQPVFGDR